MKPRRSAQCPAGVPEWVVTFGDMMSLLLCFFILLQMFSEIKQEREYQRVDHRDQGSVRLCQGGVGVMPDGRSAPQVASIEVLESIAMNRQDSDRRARSVSRNVDPGHRRASHAGDSPAGRAFVFTIGGAGHVRSPLRRDQEPECPHGSARSSLTLLAGTTTTRSTIIGHAAAKYIPSGVTRGASLDELSLRPGRRRASDVLKSSSGIDDRVFRIQAVRDAGTGVVPRGVRARQDAGRESPS